MSRRPGVERFLDLRYGVFVHWGPLAGYGKARHVDQAEHDRVAKGFEERATNFDAAAWVHAFRDCGARYVTLVPKHGFDFCLWPTEVATGHTRRDFVGEIAAACRNQDMPLFLYMNLNAAGFPDLIEAGFKGWPDFITHHHATLGQWFQEYLTRYQPAGIWLDAWPTSRFSMEKAGLDPREVFDFENLLGGIRKIDPSILILNKELVSPEVDVLTSEYLFKDHFGKSLGDFDVPIETCDILPGSGWFATRFSAEDFLSAAEIEQQAQLYLKRLLDSVGRGLNYLLDTGPLPDGSLQPVELTILQRMGDWLRNFQEAIFGTRPSDLPPQPWGYAVSSSQRTYLYVLDNHDIHSALDATEHGNEVPATCIKTGIPENGFLEIAGLRENRRVTHLPTGRSLPASMHGENLAVNLDGLPSNPVATILCLENG